MAEIRVNATGGLKLYDADDSHYAQIVAGTITSNVDAITLGHDTVTIADNLSLGSDSAILKFGADTEIALTHVADTGLKLTDSGGTPTLQLHDANESIASDGSKVIITSGGTAFNLPTSDGSNGQFIKTDGSGTLSFATVSTSTAFDDVTAGDAAVNVTTSSGDITVDAQGNDTDIIFKGTDNTSDTTFLTLDGSEGGQLVLGAHGQINFPDSANVSTDANVLDDYQEGDFNISSSQASNFFTGFYTKIGRMVFFTCAGQVPSSGNSATQTLTGMPFTVKNQAASQEGSDAAAGMISYESNNGKTASFVLRDDATTANFFQNDNNVATHATYSEDHFVLSGMYTTDQ